MQTRRVYLRSFMCTVMVFLILGCDVMVHGRKRRHQRSSSRVISEDEIQFRRNLELVQSSHWKCSQPKPRLVYLSEANHPVPPLPPDYFWAGEAAVLHRCDTTTGCCPRPQKCKPAAASIETVTVTFKKVHIGHSPDAYERIAFSNHTVCTCTT